MLIPLLLLLILPLSMSAKSECTFHDFKVHFESFNFNTILKWEAPENSKGLKYTVEYLIYGRSQKQRKPECTKITRTWCDLSDEIQVEEEYRGKVIINKKNCFSTSGDIRFNLRSHTEIGPPEVTLFLNYTSIEISLAHPIEHRHDIKGAKYFIYVNDAPPQETEEPVWSIKNIRTDTTYCVTAQLQWLYKSSNLSNKTCITTNADRRSQEIIAWMMGILPVTLIACTAILLVYATLKYIYCSNLMRPAILNITANNNNAVVVDAGSATINLITIECAKPKVLDFVPSSKQDNEEFKNQANLHITDGKDLLNCDSEVTEEAEEESDNDHAYVSLQEQVITPSPIISPYDMPHHLHEPVRELSTPTRTENEQRDAYGCIKNIATLSSTQENDLEVVSKENTSEETIEKYPYVPQDPHSDSNLSKVNKSNTDVCKPEEPILDQELETVDMIEDTGLVESGMLFVDWSPDNLPIYIPNLSRKRALENCIKQCQEENECLLSQLNLPPEVKEAAQDNELTQLEERWGLFIQEVEE